MISVKRDTNSVQQVYKVIHVIQDEILRLNFVSGINGGLLAVHFKIISVIYKIAEKHEWIKRIFFFNETTPLAYFFSGSTLKLLGTTFSEDIEYFKNLEIKLIKPEWTV